MSTIETSGTDDTIDDGAAHAAPAGIEIRTLHRADEMVGLVEVFRQVWGSVTELVTIEMLMAVSHSNGYVSAAYETRTGEERILGASVAILARHLGQPALHSHITGLLPGARKTGLGRAMKLHQQRWAAEQGIDWIVWTYDPLVRRNAWFNIAVLGAEVHEYMPSFYGAMSDSINQGDESDRLLVAWSVATDPDAPPRDGAAALADPSRHLLVPTPDDIVTLRRTDPAAVREWRRNSREALTDAIERGDRVVGFTRAGEYAIELTS
jgi:predicted GNAT superfamily acetyltransferase